MLSLLLSSCISFIWKEVLMNHSPRIVVHKAIVKLTLTLKYMAMSVAMMVIVGIVNTTMYIIVFGLYPCKVQECHQSSIQIVVLGLYPCKVDVIIRVQFNL